MIETLKSLFIRDLNKLKIEINQYKQDENLWKLGGDISNTGGNLCLHIIGNLNHFIGSVMLKTGYVRKRDAEFNDKNVPREELIKIIDDTIALFEYKFSNISKEDLELNYPINVFGEEMATQWFLIHLNGHLNYHLGQINYHRRLLDR